uniref:coiled-coil domain-containing protein 22 homolog isoform X2 n=1 Tax=Erigeron canadensis TaxID=72917 RepID=UPI001CB88FE6|nr:coiled-coil domain-containing protein 22 homolog isoform X2 [Erigeron canadensis]
MKTIRVLQSVCNQMEESQEILLNSLANVGVPISPEIVSVSDLTPESFISVCAHSLRIISKSESIPISLPESMADRFKFCTDLASSFENLGFIGDISFHKFLYPSEEDMYKLIRFLVGRLSESSHTVNIENFEKSTADEGRDLSMKVERLNVKAEEDVSSSIRNGEAGDVGLTGVENGGGLIEGAQYSKNSIGEKGGMISQKGGEYKLEQAPMSFKENPSQMSDTSDSSVNQVYVLSNDVTAKSLELQQLEEQHDLLKAAVEMACNERNPLDSYIKQLNEKIDVKRDNLAELESKWKAIMIPLEQRKRNLETAIFAKQPEWKKLENDLESVLSETKKREKELSNLSTEIEKLPKLATRRSYIERIKEITKNSRKQDIDIERILNDTRELQLESNMIQERLHRTYAVVDETLLRAAKKDQVGEQAHIILTTIHESFEEISEKILVTDRAQREAADLEDKLTHIVSGSLNMDTLQADLDAIRKENEILQSRLGNP